MSNTRWKPVTQIPPKFAGISAFLLQPRTLHKSMEPHLHNGFTYALSPQPISQSQISTFKATKSIMYPFYFNNNTTNVRHNASCLDNSQHSYKNASIKPYSLVSGKYSINFSQHFGKIKDEISRFTSSQLSVSWSCSVRSWSTACQTVWIGERASVVNVRFSVAAEQKENGQRLLTIHGVL